MLNIYYSRADTDQDRFVFSQIKEYMKSKRPEQKVLLIVPGQFTLQTEKNAFAYLNTEGFMDIEVLSFPRLQYKVLEETGRGALIPVNNYGKYMLLSRILSEEKSEFEAFGRISKRQILADMSNKLIGEMKQFNISPDDIQKICEKLDEEGNNPILKRKLSDLHKIYAKYEEAISGKYIDSEDYINLFISRIAQSKLVQHSEVWILGIGSFAPQTRSILEQMLLYSENVNIVTFMDDHDDDLFHLQKTNIVQLQQIAEKIGVKCKQTNINEIFSDQFKIIKAEALAHMEKNLYAFPHNVYAKKIEGEIELCRCANFYNEVETVAAGISSLVRDGGLRYRDITVICNDIEARGSIIKRIFSEYGISFFMDTKRSITHNPCIEFIIALLDIVCRGWRTSDVMRLIKTGFAPLEQERCEVLENYAKAYKINGSKWKKEFKYGGKDFDEETLARLNEDRNTIVNFIINFERTFLEEKTAKGKTEVLYHYLHDEVNVLEQVHGFISYLGKEEQYEYQSEFSQLWGAIVGIFDQIVTLFEDNEVEPTAYLEMLSSGFEDIEIAMIPSTEDQVLVGTVARTRPGDVRALYVMGANDGILPTSAKEEGLLSEDEKKVLLGNDVELCRHKELNEMEERVDIYRIIAKATEHFFMSYSVSGLDGKELSPSSIFERMKRIFAIEPTLDLINRAEPMALIERPYSSLQYVTGYLRDFRDGFHNKYQDSEDVWQGLYNWFVRHPVNALRKVQQGLLFENHTDQLEKDLLFALFSKGNENMPSILSVSPSRLEKYARCPFSHFVSYALRPSALRGFGINYMEMGDIYHQCLMQLARRLTKRDVEVTAEDSSWMNISEEQCSVMVEEIVSEISKSYNDGVMVSEEAEKYRCQRIKRVCQTTAWHMVEQVQKGRIKEVQFEAGFGIDSRNVFPPMKIEVQDETIYIEGKIDRVDVLSLGSELDSEGQAIDYVKIIDYKSGVERFDIQEARNGLRLQLMIYLKAAISGMENRNRLVQKGMPSDGKETHRTVRPAGVFYFNIKEPMVDLDEPIDDPAVISERITKEVKKKFRMDGILLEKEDVVKSLDTELKGSSDIVKVKMNKDGEVSGVSPDVLLSEDAFDELIKDVGGKVSSICEELINGNISITPVKNKSIDACAYCEYKSICNYQ